MTTWSRKDRSLVVDYFNDTTGKYDHEPKNLLQLQEEGFDGLEERLRKQQEEVQVEADKKKYRNYGIRFDTLTQRWVGNR